MEKDKEISQTNIGSETSTQDSSKDVQHEERDYYKLGETVRFANGLELTLTDVGTVSDKVLGKNYVYISVEIQNTGTETVGVSGTYFNFYGDNYSMSVSITAFGDEMLHTQNLGPGRKTSGKIFADCDEYNAINVLEVQFGDAVFRLKDATAIQESVSQSSYLALSGRYVEVEGKSEISISMYSSPEEQIVGNAEVNFGEYNYSGEIAEVTTNVYCLMNTDDEVTFEIYESRYETFYLALYVNGELKGEYWMQEHYES